MDKRKKKQVDVSNNGRIDDYFKKKGVPPKQHYIAPSPLHRIKKDTKDTKKKNDYHMSSKEASIASDVTQPVGQNQQIPETYVCKQLIMIGPCDVYYYASIKKRFQKLMEKYSKAAFIRTVAQNAKYSRIKDLRNLEQIDDDQFWSKSAPIIIEMVCDDSLQKKICSCVEIMISGVSKIVTLNRFQIFLILANMLLCSFPKQNHRGFLNFAELMGTKQNEDPKNRFVRKQKLKCIVNYFNQMTKKTVAEMEFESIDIQRVRNLSSLTEVRDVGCQLKDVILQSGHIQDYYKKSIMVDFANSNIGGGVLTNGAVQQQILFVIFPQLIASICICPQLQENEALIFYDALKFSEYKGYSREFQYVGPHDDFKDASERSIIIAIDAVNYKNKLANTQFRKRSIDRELMKAIAGFQGVQMGAEQDMWICTGRWGCGAFGGDIYLKFLIQWISCSLANRGMLYLAQDKQQKQELEVMVGFLKDKYISSEILEVMEDYHNVVIQGCKLSFLQFFKFQI